MVKNSNEKNIVIVDVNTVFVILFDTENLKENYSNINNKNYFLIFKVNRIFDVITN